VPEIAAAQPKISEDGKNYRFTIRKGLRFSTGSPVTARAVAYTINRDLNLERRAPGTTIGSLFKDIVGAQDVIDGKASSASGIAARAGVLTIRLVHPAGDFTWRMSFPCVVPANLPADPEGAKAPIPSAAPYYVAEYVPNMRVVLLRNRYYRGKRPHHIDRFEVDLTGDATSVLDRVDRSTLDYAWVPNIAYAVHAVEFKQKYGVNKRRFFTSPGGFLREFVLNTSRPLFRNNVPLRRAVNFAVDRRALARERGPLAAFPTDQFLWPGLFGFRDEHIYPLKGDLRRARSLARGHTRSGKAVLFVSTTPTSLAQGQIVKSALKRIGLDVDVQAFPTPVLFQKLATPGERFDIGWIGWSGAPGDPGAFLDGLFDGRVLGKPESGNYSYFNSPRYNRLFARLAPLSGPARYRAYGNLDIDLSKNAAPAIPYAYDSTMNLVSNRTGCAVFNPYLDLAAVCLR
jgi:peptide/nickel transport system substrate-binding protein